MEIDGPLLILTTELPLGRVIEEVGGEIDRIDSIGRTQPRLRDVLRQMLRVSGGEQP
jgi:hypothetical protein